jgi:uroporphyrinogen decarboxylase
MTSLERVLTTLSHKEPDRVPIFYPLTMHGAKELGLSINEYFSRAEHVVEGQLRMRQKYQHDFIYTFFYAAVEIEAWGGAVLYTDDGPPNAAEPFLRTLDMIPSLQVPDVPNAPALRKVLHAIEMLKARVGNEVPIVGVVMSPFSLPIMQMGFERYIELIYEHPDHFEQLMRVNEAFCIAWANAQLAAGATAIGYFDPVSSPTIIPRDLYLQTGYPIAQRMVTSINGPLATLLASGRVLPIADDIARTGTAIVGASWSEDLAALKERCREHLTVMGNLNAIEMCRWTAEQAETEVKRVLASAAPGGGFILSDNHGEIPWQVPEHVLLATTEAVMRWGTYPLEWIHHEGHEGTDALHRHL